MITQKYIKDCLVYCPNTGVFTWRTDRPRAHFSSDRIYNWWMTKYAGKKAGSKNNTGYIMIRISSYFVLAHRLAFLYVSGSLPVNHVDHINHDGLDNRWSNIREANFLQNSKNQSLSSKNKTGIMGVCWHKTKENWQANIGGGKNRAHLGAFDCFFEACCARKSAESRLEYHENHGSGKRKRIDFRYD